MLLMHLRLNFILKDFYIQSLHFYDTDSMKAPLVDKD